MERQHKKKFAGDQRSQKLRVVCVTCNNRWMSVLQTNAKPYLLPLLQGRFGHLSVKAQSHIAAWACMFSMVFERLDSATAAITQEDRTAFMNERAVPPNWFVWIALGNKVFGKTLTTNHMGWCIEVPEQAKDHCNVQMTVSNPGELCFVTFSATAQAWDVISKSLLRHFEWRHDLHCVWPPVERNVFEAPAFRQPIGGAEALKLISDCGDIFSR